MIFFFYFQADKSSIYGSPVFLFIGFLLGFFLWIGFVFILPPTDPYIFAGWFISGWVWFWYITLQLILPLTMLLQKDQAKIRKFFRIFIMILFFLIWFSCLCHMQISPLFSVNQKFAHKPCIRVNLNPDWLENHSSAEYGNNSFLLFLDWFQYVLYQSYLIRVSHWIAFQILLHSHWFPHFAFLPRRVCLLFFHRYCSLQILLCFVWLLGAQQRIVLSASGWSDWQGNRFNNLLMCLLYSNLFFFLLLLIFFFEFWFQNLFA